MFLKPLNIRLVMRSAQAGFGLPMALFVITVLALIIASMSQLQNDSSNSIGLQVNSHRAFYSAEAGVEIALNLLIPPDGSVARSCATTPFYSKTYTIAGLNNCSVSVICDSILVNSNDYYTLRSTGYCGNGIDRAQRTVEVRVK
jgi:MSHA biogenesis protein MshP